MTVAKPPINPVEQAQKLTTE